MSEPNFMASHSLVVEAFYEQPEYVDIMVKQQERSGNHQRL